MSSPYWLIFLSLSLRGYESEFGCGDWSELKPWQLRGVREVVEFELELVNEICMYNRLFLCRLAMLVFFIIINLIFLIFYLKAEKKKGVAKAVSSLFANAIKLTRILFYVIE